MLDACSHSQTYRVDEPNKYRVLQTLYMRTRTPYESQLAPRTLPSTHMKTTLRALSVPTIASVRKTCAGECVHDAPEMPREPKIVVV